MSKAEQQKTTPMNVGTTTSSNSIPISKLNPDSPFTTTSDIIRFINSALQDLDGPVVVVDEDNDDAVGNHHPLLAGRIGDEDDDDDSDEEQERNDDDSNEKRNECNSETKKKESNSTTTTTILKAAPRFELQKRLPDGSTRRATETEHAAADMESKIQQVAAHVASLSSPEEKKDWLERQRNYGNQLYQKATTVAAIQHQAGGDHDDFVNDEQRCLLREAIDVYLTCLLVAQDDLVLLLQVMNNLAQAALKLGWFSKAEQFCSMALQSWNERKPRIENDADDYENKCRQHVSKIYFKRGKARRLKGEYRAAKSDLLLAQTWLGHAAGVASTETGATSSPEERAIQKELLLLAKAKSEGRRNKKRQARAMKLVLGSTSSSPTKESTYIAKLQQATTKATTNTATTSVSSTTSSSTAIPPPLYGDISATSSTRRAYSSIRAPSKPKNRAPHQQQENDNNNEEDQQEVALQQLSYWQYYVLVVGRIAKKLLEWSGDEEYQSTKKQNEFKQD